MTVNGGQAVLETLRAHGIDRVFGLLGGSMLELYDAIYHAGDVGYIGARDERAAAHMADAWARVTGRPGVCDATLGPGATNLLTALTESLNAGIPIIAMIGDCLLPRTAEEAVYEGMMAGRAL